MPSPFRGRSVLVVLLLAALSALPMWAASAHSALIGSNPSNGSSVSALPAEIELRFNDKLSPMAPALILRHDNETVAKLQPRINGTLLRAESPPQELTDGSYQLVWRVVSVDGHPLSGAIAFRIGGNHAPAAHAPATAQAPPQSSTSKTTAIALSIAPIALIAVLLVRRRLNRSDIKKEQP